jgi:hypothetical protein
MTTMLRLHKIIYDGAYTRANQNALRTRIQKSEGQIIEMGHNAKLSIEDLGRAKAGQNALQTKVHLWEQFARVYHLASGL